MKLHKRFAAVVHAQAARDQLEEPRERPVAAASGLRARPAPPHAAEVVHERSKGAVARDRRARCRKRRPELASALEDIDELVTVEHDGQHSGAIELVAVLQAVRKYREAAAAPP
ncbi:MAG TPA: hypothetical protein VD838_09455 [Anaeromyxobacteraceae bacterium]|nr:hypothetical protein [Anaeromyxobacteraceae bacterium]